MNTFSREMSIDKLVSELIRVHKENIETWRSEEKRVDRLKAGSQYSSEKILCPYLKRVKREKGWWSNIN